MKNWELEKILKSASIPERPESYWEAFPGRLRSKIRFGTDRSEPEKAGFGHFVFPGRLHFAGFCAALVAVGILAGFALGFRQGRLQPITDSQAASAAKFCREIQALFPNRVKAIFLNRQDSSLELSDDADIPAAMPLYLRISSSTGYWDIVTFSGQTIRFDGESCEVLLDSQGRVILAGQRRVWASDQASAKQAAPCFTARLLEKVL